MLPFSCAFTHFSLVHHVFLTSTVCQPTVNRGQLEDGIGDVDVFKRVVTRRGGEVLDQVISPLSNSILIELALSRASLHLRVVQNVIKRFSIY